MALINTIREKSGLTIVVLGIALVAFIVGDYLAGTGGGSAGTNKVGEIAGNLVDQKQFNNLVEFQRQQFEAQNGRSAGEADLDNIRAQVWEQLIQDYAFDPEYQELGISVSPDELRELLQGTNNMHPYTRQFFTDPQTGQFNAEQHSSFITAAANKTLTLAQQSTWDQFKMQLLKFRSSEKYQNLLAKSDFITTAQAEQQYAGEAEKISANYLYVPFYSLNDTTVEVTDSRIESYYSDHQDEFDGYDSRDIDYVVFQVVPSAEDSAAVMEDINKLARGIAGATNAAAYATANSDMRSSYLKAASEITPEVKDAISTALEGSVVGPFKEGQNYSIYKYEGTERDSLYTARASHILVRSAATDTPEQQAEARKKANDILSQLRSGSNFATLARINSEDGSAQQGGDLGYFQNNGQMVKPFEDAIFGFNGSGLIPRVVKTDFGYHLINVTEAKSNIKYKLATVTKVLEASEATRNQYYQDAEDLRISVSSLSDLQEKAEADENLVLLSALRVGPGSKNVNTLENAGEFVRWAYNDNTEISDIADRVFEVDDAFIVAGLKGGTDAEEPKASDFKDQIAAKVRNELKAELIMSNLDASAGTLDEVARTYGAGALVESVSDINFQSGLLNSAGLDPIALGKAFGMNAGQKSAPFVGTTGVFIMETSNKTTAPEIADYSQYKEQIKQRNGQFAFIQAANNAIRDKAEITDRRAKLF